MDGRGQWSGPIRSDPFLANLRYAPNNPRIGVDIRRWAKENKVELCFTPTCASWAYPIEARFGPLRQFTLANSQHRGHPAQTPGPAPLPALEQCRRPATLTYSPPSAGNVPVSEVRRGSAGADAPSPPQPDGQ